MKTTLYLGAGAADETCVAGRYEPDEHIDRAKMQTAMVTRTRSRFMFSNQLLFADNLYEFGNALTRLESEGWSGVSADYTDYPDPKIEGSG